MATLETIRTKAGVLISAVIGLALLSFIISPDTFSMAKSMVSDDNSVGRVRGKAISYEEYNSKVERLADIYRGSSPTGTLSENDMRSVREEIWSALIAEYVIVVEAEKLGITVTDKELTDAMIGSDPHPDVRASFTNPNTGQFDREYLSAFIQQMDGKPMAKNIWLHLEDKIKLSLISQKYWALDNNSIFVNKVEVENSINVLKNNSHFSYVVKEYSEVNDADISLTESYTKALYNKYKPTLWKEKGSDIEYAIFSVEPQAIDFERIAREMASLETKITNEDVNNLDQFVALNSEVSFDNAYKGRGNIRPIDLDSFAFAGNIGDTHPVFQIGNTYYVSRIKDIKSLPDSVNAEHILLSQENILKADSIIAELKKGANFADLANQFSIDNGANLQGGDLGWFNYEAMVRPFSDSCFFNSYKGKIAKVATQFGVHIVRVKELKDYTKKVQLATVQLTVEAGRETYADIYNKASNLVSECAGDGSKLPVVAMASGITLLTESNINYSTDRIAFLADSKSLIRWTCEAKEGDLSEIIDIEGNTKFAVARVTKVTERGIAPFEQARLEIERLAKTQLKAEKIESEIAEALSSSTTIDEFARKAGRNVLSVTNPINFSTAFIPSLPVVEPKLIGAVSAAASNKLIGPVRGENGVYVVMVTSIEEKITVEDLEESRDLLFNRRLGQTNMETNKVLLKVGDFVDNRGKFY